MSQRHLKLYKATCALPSKFGFLTGGFLTSFNIIISQSMIYIHQKPRHHLCHPFYPCLSHVCYTLPSPIEFMPKYLSKLSIFFYLHYTILVQVLIMSFFHYINCFLIATIHIDTGFLPIHIFRLNTQNNQMIFSKQTLEHVTYSPYSRYLVKTL